MMFTPDSLGGVAFRYARWLRETDQWDAMDLFTDVIHPAVGQVIGLGGNRVWDIRASTVRRSLYLANRLGVSYDLAYGAWADFLDFLTVEGVPFRDDLLDQAPLEDVGA